MRSSSKQKQFKHYVRCLFNGLVSLLPESTALKSRDRRLPSSAIAKRVLSDKEIASSNPGEATAVNGQESKISPFPQGERHGLLCLSTVM